jgi:hypothetical protein
MGEEDADAAGRVGRRLRGRRRRRKASKSRKLSWGTIHQFVRIIETLRYTRARDHGFYATREGRGDRPRVGGSVATGGPRAVTAAQGAA